MRTSPAAGATTAAINETGTIPPVRRRPPNTPTSGSWTPDPQPRQPGVRLKRLAVIAAGDIHNPMRQVLALHRNHRTRARRRVSVRCQR